MSRKFVLRGQTSTTQLWNSKCFSSNACTFGQSCSHAFTKIRINEGFTKCRPSSPILGVNYLELWILRASSHKCQTSRFYSLRLVFLSSNDLGIGKLLLGKGIDINVRNNDGMAAIHLTVQKGNTRFLQWLLREKCDVNLKVMFSILHLIRLNV